MPTAAAPNVENPKLAADLNSTPPDSESDSSATPLLPSAGAATDPKVKPAVSMASNHDFDGGGAVTDIQKKMKRAERFGMPVQLSEKEKRNSRAERFGSVQSAPADEELKKKARLARFGASVIDSTEEDKKKARALRSSQLNSESKVNGKGNIEVKAAIAGKAGGGS